MHQLLTHTGGIIPGTSGAEPIFADLFEAYGEQNVSALYNSRGENIDPVLACNISRSLYFEILRLPGKHAVDALRWLLSP